MPADYRRFESARDSPSADEAAAPASPSALDVDSAAASLPASSSVPPSSASSRVKHFVRRHWCMSACVLVLVTLGFALLAWRLVMGAKYSAASVENAHLSFDSPPAVPGAPPVQRRPALSAASIKLLVWNLKKGQEAGLEHDLPAYSADRDLLVLSEGLLNAHGRTIFDSMAGVHWEMGVAFRYAREADTPPTGTLLGSTHVLPSWVRVALSEDREPIINTPKCMTMAKYPLTRDGDADAEPSSLLVISIHGVNAVSADALDRQLAQAAGEIRAHVGPVVFAGDFNTNTADKVSRLRRLTTGDLSMREVSYRNDARKTVFGQVIDYVFTRGLRTVDAEVLGSLTSSDHKAMLVELRLE